MTAIIDRVGQNNTIFYEELMPLVSAMQQRANQPKVPPEKWESVWKLCDDTYEDTFVFQLRVGPTLYLSHSKKRRLTT